MMGCTDYFAALEHVQQAGTPAYGPSPLWAAYRAWWAGGCISRHTALTLAGLKAEADAELRQRLGYPPPSEDG